METVRGVICEHEYQTTGHIYINQEDTSWMIAERSDIPKKERKKFSLYNSEYCHKCRMRRYEVIGTKG